LRRNKIILVDYSQTALSAILSFQRELKGNDADVVNLIRHVILSSLQNIKKKHGREYGQLVICADGRNYWRRDIFPHYKAGRKKTRDASGLPWTLIFDTMSSIRDDLQENFPYKVIHYDRAEADDAIAVLCKWTQDNDLIQEGLEESAQKVLIISSDHDFKQLHRFPNVRQWSPKIKKLMAAETDYMTVGHIQHIVKASDDGIPNILSADDVFVIGERQKVVSAKRLAEFVEHGYNGCKTDDERKNWHRNIRLVDFEFIPAEVSEEIINKYINSKVVNDKMKIMNYLIKNRCRLLLDSIEGF
jgi:hypothetical protein